MEVPSTLGLGSGHLAGTQREGASSPAPRSAAKTHWPQFLSRVATDPQGTLRAVQFFIQQATFSALRIAACALGIVRRALSFPVLLSSFPISIHELIFLLCLCLLGSLDASLWPDCLRLSKSGQISWPLPVMGCFSLRLGLTSPWRFGNPPLICPHWFSVCLGLPFTLLFVFVCLCLSLSSAL